MKKMRTIYEALINRKEKICQKSDIMEIIKDYNKTLGKIDKRNALWYLARRNYIKRIMLGYYYINSMDERVRNMCRYEDKELVFIVLNKLNIKWYIGLRNALYLLGKTWQTPNRLTIINNKISGKKNVLGISIRFVKSKESLIFGLKKAMTKNNIPYRYSDEAKTDLDLVYFKESTTLTKRKETKKYLKKYPKWLSKLI